MEMAYRERWEAEIAAMRRVLAGFAMKEECKWGKPTYTVDGKNVVILQGFKESFALGFFQGALLKDPKKVLVQLGRVPAGRVMNVGCASDGTCDPPAIVHSATSTPLGQPAYARSLVSLPARTVSRSNATPSAASVPVHPFFAAQVAIVCASDG